MPGDYISREAAIKNVINQMRVSKSELCMRERLLNLEAADVRPVVRGKWVQGDMPTYGGYKCSVCGANTVLYKANFCPNCGADMRELEDEKA